MAVNTRDTNSREKERDGANIPTKREDAMRDSGRMI